MRKFVSMFMILALVVTTTMAPSVSHAMPNNGTKAAQKQVSQGEDCHHGMAKAAPGEIAQSDKDASGKCCDKGMCKCIGGACHNGLAKIFNSGANSLLLILSASHDAFTFEKRFVDSALPNRLKRPPKA